MTPSFLFISTKNRNTRHIALVTGLILLLTSQGFGQALTITSPTFENIWVGGTTHEITWTGGSSENVKIKLWWGDLIDLTLAQLTPNDGSYEFEVPDGYTERVQVWIYGVNEYAVSGFMRENSQGGIYINSPAYGVTWEPGSTHSITWTDNISENVKIDLYLLLNGETGEKLFVSEIEGSTASDGYYSWTIPGETEYGSNYLIRIESVSASSTRVYSRTFKFGEETSSCADEYEPNDEIENPSKYAFSSSIGGKYYASESIAGTLDETGDWDHYRVNVEYPGNLDITLRNVPDAYDLQLYTYPPKDYVAGSFTSGNEHIDFDIPIPGYYYIIVGSVEGAYDCSPYTLDVDWAADLFLDVAPASRSVGSSSGTTTFEVSSNANWWVTEDASWLSAEKTSSGLLTVTYDENSESSSRSASITISADGVASDIVTVTQEGAVCSLSVAPVSRSVGSGAGTTIFTVASNVSWSVNETTDWLTASVEGSTVTVNYLENTSVTGRNATLTISGGSCSETVSVVQDGAACSLSVTPVSRNVGATAGTTSFLVTSNVSWSVNETADWLTASVDGSTITVNYLENTSVTGRTATLIVSGGGCSETLFVIQDGNACSLSVTPESRSVGATAGTTSFIVTSNVSWSVNETADWLSTSVDGSTVTVNYLENTSVTGRTATLSISGGGCSETVSVVQDGSACSLSVTPESRSVGATAGTTSFIVTSNVSWSVNETADWLTTSVDGNIVIVSFNVNGTASPRSAAITIAGGGCSREVTLVQGAGEQPQFEIGTSALSIGATAGSAATFNITSNVDWSIENNAPWLNVNPLNGTGSSQVTVEANESNNTGTTRAETLQATGNGTTYSVVVTQDYITGVITEMENGITVYPNPTGSELYVKLGTQLEDFTVRITDSRGSLLFSNKYKSATEFTIDLGNFDSGVFQIVIMNKDGSIVRTFIK